MPIKPRRVWQEDGSIITLVRGVGTLCTQTTADSGPRSAQSHVGAASACPQLQGKPQAQPLALLFLCLSTPLFSARTGLPPLLLYQQLHTNGG